mgnify:CR=1 FL=1
MRGRGGSGALCQSEYDVLRALGLGFDSRRASSQYSALGQSNQLRVNAPVCTCTDSGGRDGTTSFDADGGFGEASGIKVGFGKASLPLPKPNGQPLWLPRLPLNGQHGPTSSTTSKTDQNKWRNCWKSLHKAQQTGRTPGYGHHCTVVSVTCDLPFCNSATHHFR